MNNPLVLCGTAIRQDVEGRYCLNDLHRSSGDVNHHRPSKWLATKQAQELITEIELEARIRASNSVRGHGITATYVVKELVYAYAMWISPAFHLAVIRAYDAIVTDQLLKPYRQHEKCCFEKNPHWRDIRPLSLQGLKNIEIAQRLGMSAGRVGRAIKNMIREGLIDPAVRIAARYQPATAQRLMQLPLNLSWGT